MGRWSSPILLGRLVGLPDKCQLRARNEVLGNRVRETLRHRLWRIKNWGIMGSVEPEGGHGVDARGASCWDVGGEHGDEQEHQRGGR